MDCIHASDGDFDVSTNVLVCKRTFLLNVLLDACARGYTS